MPNSDLNIPEVWEASRRLEPTLGTLAEEDAHSKSASSTDRLQQKQRSDLQERLTEATALGLTSQGLSFAPWDNFNDEAVATCNSQDGSEMTCCCRPELLWVTEDKARLETELAATCKQHELEIARYRSEVEALQAEKAHLGTQLADSYLRITHLNVQLLSLAQRTKAQSTSSQRNTTPSNMSFEEVARPTALGGREIFAQVVDTMPTLEASPDAIMSRPLVASEALDSSCYQAPQVEQELSANSMNAEKSGATSGTTLSSRPWVRPEAPQALSRKGPDVENERLASEKIQASFVRPSSPVARGASPVARVPVWRVGCVSVASPSSNTATLENRFDAYNYFALAGVGHTKVAVRSGGPSAFAPVPRPATCVVRSSSAPGFNHGPPAVPVLSGGSSSAAQVWPAPPLGIAESPSCATHGLVDGWRPASVTLPVPGPFVHGLGTSTSEAGPGLQVARPSARVLERTRPFQPPPLAFAAGFLPHTEQSAANPWRQWHMPSHSDESGLAPLQVGGRSVSPARRAKQLVLPPAPPAPV